MSLSFSREMLSLSGVIVPPSTATRFHGITRAGSNVTNGLVTYNTLNGLNNPGGGGGAPSVPTYNAPANFDGSLNYGSPAPATTPGYS